MSLLFPKPSKMANKILKMCCSLCNSTKENQTRYGARCCKACSMFFKRMTESLMVKGADYLPQCNGRKLKYGKKSCSKCDKLQRFEKCLQHGMKMEKIEEFPKRIGNTEKFVAGVWQRLCENMQSSKCRNQGKAGSLSLSDQGLSDTETLRKFGSRGFSPSGCSMSSHESIHQPYQAYPVNPTVSSIQKIDGGIIIQDSDVLSGPLCSPRNSATMPIYYNPSSYSPSGLSSTEWSLSSLEPMHQPYQAYPVNPTVPSILEIDYDDRIQDYNMATGSLNGPQSLYNWMFDLWNSVKTKREKFYGSDMGITVPTQLTALSTLTSELGPVIMKCFDFDLRVLKEILATSQNCFQMPDSTPIELPRLDSNEMLEKARPGYAICTCILNTVDVIKRNKAAQTEHKELYVAPNVYLMIEQNDLDIFLDLTGIYDLTGLSSVSKDLLELMGKIRCCCERVSDTYISDQDLAKALMATFLKAILPTGDPRAALLLDPNYTGYNGACGDLETVADELLQIVQKLEALDKQGKTYTCRPPPTQEQSVL
ncbi:hypothetical protein L596_025109 [Steinernema carpocapsae]|uniref:Nuclear receptor domain-containing protein n=1 Tax=Steinernema carpocapsae TaxID=34508 RepID=A0A4U5M6U9_STECR|nr:hypothetical protein L596_025109 [Steinernema carpocapsae]